MKIEDYLNLNNRWGGQHPLWIGAVLVIILSLALPAGLLQAAPGVDGNLTVSAADIVLNRYSAVTAVSGNVITVSDISELDDGSAGHYANETLSAGDMILIYQAQGASFTDNRNVATYGEFDYNNSGRYEFGVVESVAGNDITVDGTNSAPYSCGGISNTYDTAGGHVQVVRVPQYASLTIDNGASVIAPDWDGSVGGVVALLAQGAMVDNGLIDASGSGFRGGRLDEDSTSHTLFVTLYRSGVGFDAAVKGESILGEDAEYYLNGGPYGRGAPANGGGGGNSHNAGGGGGANGDSGGTWTGAGLPDTSNSGWDNAWDLDDTVNDPGTPLPSYFSNGAGGGRGGYSYGEFDADATAFGPNHFVWGGNHRFQIGGLGGRPLSNDPGSRLFFGGGGGAGEDNNLSGTRGANGGGLVIIAAGSLSGSGQILSNGDDAEDIFMNYEDGAGGGGAGGSVVIKTSDASGVLVRANGGSGGDTGTPVVHPNESFGPGGGGGGGFVAVHSSSGSLTTAANGGTNGVSASDGVTEFIPNGSTGGYDGNTTTAAFSFPGCSAPTAITLVSASVTAHLSWWPLLVLFLLLMASRYMLKGRLFPVPVRNRK